MLDSLRHPHCGVSAMRQLRVYATLIKFHPWTQPNPTGHYGPFPCFAQWLNSCRSPMDTSLDVPVVTLCQLAGHPCTFQALDSKQSRSHRPSSCGQLPGDIPQTQYSNSTHLSRIPLTITELLRVIPQWLNSRSRGRIPSLKSCGHSPTYQVHNADSTVQQLHVTAVFPGKPGALLQHQARFTNATRNRLR